MSFKEVKELRKAGKLDKALSKAIADLEAALRGVEMETITLEGLGDSLKFIEGKSNVQVPIGILWAKRALAWVYYDYLRKYSRDVNVDSFIECLVKVKDLQLPSDEKLFYDNSSWQIGSVIFALQKKEPVEYNKIDGIFDIIHGFSFTKPSEAFSFLYKAFHKGYQNWSRYLAFADWWNFESFRTEDYLSDEFEGKKMISIVEQAYIAYAKKSLIDPEIIDGKMIANSVNKERLNKFLPKLDKLIDQHPEFIYPPYYKAKILLAMGDSDNTIYALLPFAKVKRNEFWVWEVLSDAYPSDSDLFLACLCRSVLCKVLPEFLVKVNEKLAAALIIRSLYVEAKNQIQICLRSRESQGWGMTRRLNQWVNQSWYKETAHVDDITPFLKKHAAKADELLFADMPEDLIVVEFVNGDKNILNFIASRQKSGFFNYADKLQSPSIGNVYRARLKPLGNEGFYQIITIRETDEIPDLSVLKHFTGTAIVHEQGFGLVNDIYIEPTLVKKSTIEKNDNVSGLALISYNKKRGNWGWKAIKIQKS